MSDIFRSIVDIPSPFNMVVLIVLIGSLFGVIGTIATQIRKYASHRADIHLKRELVERGLTVEEIERVVAARSPHSNPSADEQIQRPLIFHSQRNKTGRTNNAKHSKRLLDVA